MFNIQTTVKEEKTCYKVLMADKNDEIIDINAALFIGVALEVCAQEQRKTKWQGTLGILNSSACK